MRGIAGLQGALRLPRFHHLVAQTTVRTNTNHITLNTVTPHHTLSTQTDMYVTHTVLTFAEYRMRSCGLILRF